MAERITLADERRETRALKAARVPKVLVDGIAVFVCDMPHGTLPPERSDGNMLYRHADVPAVTFSGKL